MASIFTLDGSFDVYYSICDGKPYECGMDGEDILKQDEPISDKVLKKIADKMLDLNLMGYSYGSRRIIAKWIENEVAARSSNSQTNSN